MSKIVSVNPRFQSVLFKKTTAFASRVSGQTHLHSLTQAGPPPGPVIPQDAIFYAPLESDLKDIVNDIDGTYSRNTDGTYETASGWRIAGPNEPRFGKNGILMERAVDTTNFCTNHNNAPGTSLSGVNGNGATISSVSNPAALAAAGLSIIVPAGNVFEADNQTAGPVGVTINSSSTASAGHNGSCWINTFGNNVDFGFAGGPNITVNSTSLTRFNLGASLSAGQNMEFVIAAGNKIEFILNQIERYTTSTPIITQGAAATRAYDVLTWDMSGVFPSLADGMESIYITNSFEPPPSGAQPSGTFNGILIAVNNDSGRGLLLLQHGTSLPTFHNIGIRTDAGGSTGSGVAYTDKDKTFRGIGRWNAGTDRIQASQTDNNDVWQDTTEAANAALTTDNIVRLMFRGGSFSRCYYNYELSKFALWNEDKGLQWIKDNA